MPSLQAMLVDGHDDRPQKRAERSCNGLKLLIEGAIEHRPVHVPYQMDEAALLQTIEAVVSGIEIRDQHAIEALEHLSEKLAFPRGSKYIYGGLHIGEDPHIARSRVQ